jgi:hypothetical protein
LSNMRYLSIITAAYLAASKWGLILVSAAPNDPSPAPTKQPTKVGDGEAYYYAIIVIIVVPIIIVAALFARRRLRYVGRSPYPKPSPPAYLAENVPQMSPNTEQFIMGEDGQSYYNDGRGQYFTADGSRHMIFGRDGTQFFADRLPIAEASAPALQTAQDNTVPTAIAYPVKTPTSSLNPNATTGSNNGAPQPIRYGQYRNSSGQLLERGAATGFAGGLVAEARK